VKPQLCRGARVVTTSISFGVRSQRFPDAREQQADRSFFVSIARPSNMLISMMVYRGEAEAGK
jgi:hypothetical protein